MVQKFHELLWILKKLQIENSNSHHEDSSNFAGKLYKHIKKLPEALPVNPFLFENEMICKINDSFTDLPKDT